MTFERPDTGALTREFDSKIERTAGAELGRMNAALTALVTQRVLDAQLRAVEKDVPLHNAVSATAAFLTKLEGSNVPFFFRSSKVTEGIDTAVTSLEPNRKQF